MQKQLLASDRYDKQTFRGISRGWARFIGVLVFVGVCFGAYAGIAYATGGVPTAPVEMILQQLTVTDHDSTQHNSTTTYYKHKATVTATFVKDGMDPVKYKVTKTIKKDQLDFPADDQISITVKPTNKEFQDAALTKIKEGIVLNGTYSVTLLKNGGFYEAKQVSASTSAKYSDLESF